MIRTTALLALLSLTACAPATPNLAPPDPAAGVSGTAASTEPTAAAATEEGPKFSTLGDVAVKDAVLFEVETTLKCCGDAKDAWDGATARFYLAPFGDVALGGYVLYLDAEDRPVLAAQEGEQGRYTKQLWRGEKATRSDKAVGFTVPSSSLPKGPLKVWSGSRKPSKVDGKAIAETAPDGGIGFLKIVRPDDGPVVEEPAGPKGDPAKTPPGGEAAGADGTAPSPPGEGAAKAP
jgi:hypothetical protein